MNLKKLLIESKLSATNESRKKYKTAFATVYIKSVEELDKYIKQFDSFYDYIKSVKSYKNPNHGGGISLEFASLKSSHYGYVSHAFEHTLICELKKNGRDYYVDNLHNLYIRELVKEFLEKSKFLKGFDVEYSPDVIKVGGHAYEENEFSVEIVLDYTEIADQFDSLYTRMRKSYAYDGHLRDLMVKDSGESSTTLKGILYKEIDFDEFANSKIRIDENGRDLLKILNPSNSKLSSSAKKIYKETVDWINKANEQGDKSAYEKEKILLKRNYKAFNNKKAILTFLSLTSLYEQWHNDRRSGKDVDNDINYLLRMARGRLLDYNFAKYAYMLKYRFPELASDIWVS